MAPSECRPATERLLHFAVSAGLLLLVYCVYSRVAAHEFLSFDDNSYVYDNNQVLKGLTWDGFIWACRTTQTHNWHPLTHLSQMLDVQLFGLNAGAHALHNVFLHGVASVLLYLLGVRLTGRTWGSALVAAVFALHPANVENVAWISERKSILCAVFSFGTLLAYARYARRPTPLRYLSVGFLLAGALMSKSAAVTLPAVFLLLDLWPLGRWAAADNRTRGFWRPPPMLLWEKLPFLAASAAVSIVTILAQGPGISSLPLSIRASNTAVCMIEYLQLFLWPRNLSPFYAFVGVEPREVWIAAALLAGIGGAIIACWRQHRPVFVGFCWFVGTMLPMSGLIQVGAQRMADRYLYFPMVGLALVVVTAATWGATRAPRLRIPVCLLALGWLGHLGLAAHQQTAIWRNNSSLFASAGPAGEHFEAVTVNKASLALKEGRLPEAERLFRKLPPQHRVRMNGLIRICYGTGRKTEALRLIRERIADRTVPFDERLHFSIILTIYAETALAKEQFELSRATIPTGPHPQASAEKIRQLLADPTLTFERFQTIVLSETPAAPATAAEEGSP
jgi:hypothetical protein